MNKLIPLVYVSYDLTEVDEIVCPYGLIEEELKISRYDSVRLLFQPMRVLTSAGFFILTKKVPCGDAVDEEIKELLTGSSSEETDDGDAMDCSEDEVVPLAASTSRQRPHGCIGGSMSSPLEHPY